MLFRIKNNCVFIDDKNSNIYIDDKNKCINLNNKNKNTIKDDNVRFITYKSNKPITIKDKDNKYIKLEEHILCNLATNLPLNEYNNDSIKKIYLMRWDIEVFFKLLKSNFKFACLKEHNNNTIEQYKKKYVIILINLYLIRLIECVYDNNNKKNKNNNKNDKNNNKNNNKNDKNNKINKHI